MFKLDAINIRQRGLFAVSVRISFALLGVFQDFLRWQFLTELFTNIQIAWLLIQGRKLRFSVFLKGILKGR
jgi:hypothetical protein